MHYQVIAVDPYLKLDVNALMQSLCTCTSLSSTLFMLEQRVSKVFDQSTSPSVGLAAKMPGSEVSTDSRAQAVVCEC